MSISGIVVADKVVKEYELIKLKKTCNYIQMLIVDKKEINVEKCDAERPGNEPEDRKKHYEQFLAQLPPEDCRFIIYDFQFKLPTGGERNILIFIHWFPEIASVSKKMVYAASKGAIIKKCPGLNHEFQATDLSDITYQEIFDTLVSKVK